MKIRTKITIYFTIITAILLVLAMLLIYFFSNKGRENRFRKILKTKASTSINLYLKIKKIDSNLLKIIDSHKKDLLTSEKISIFNNDGKEIYTNNSSYKFKNIYPNLNRTFKKVSSENGIYDKAGELEIVGVEYKYGKKKLYILASAHDQLGLLNLKNLKFNLTIVFFIILSFICILAWEFSKKILQPINNLIKEINSIESSNLSKRIINATKQDEIGELISTFNKMIHRIEVAYNIQKNFSSNISHELKNPLASITAQLEVITLKDYDYEGYKKAISSVLEDIYFLNDVTESMILLTKINNETDNTYFENIRIDEFLYKNIEIFKEKHKDFEFLLSIESLPEDESCLKFLINEKLLKRCFYNIFDNAYKYCMDKKMVIILKVDSRNFEIIFSNQFNENHISVKDISYLFEPFQRGQTHHEIIGSGLGLNIIQQIAKIHSFQTSIKIFEPSSFSFILNSTKF